MFKNIPFYGTSEVVKSVKQVEDNLYEYEIYDKDGNVSKKIVSLSKEELLRQYLDQINVYLFLMKDKYEEACDIIKSGDIRRNSINILIASIIAGIGFPFLGYAINSALLYYLGFVVTGLICVPALICSLEELIFKKSEKSIKSSILEYNELKLERDKIIHKLEELNLNKEETKFSNIKPMKQEERVFGKKLVKKKE